MTKVYIDFYKSPHRREKCVKLIEFNCYIITVLLCAVIQFRIGTEGIVLAQTVLAVTLICECGKQFFDGTRLDRKRKHENNNPNMEIELSS